jgi:hypothetical protein
LEPDVDVTPISDVRAPPVGRDRQEPLVGSAPKIQGQLRPHVDAGATSIVVSIQPPFSTNLMREFATEVMPAFR